MERSSPDAGALSRGRSPRTSTSCGSCAPATSTSTRRGRCCASRWPGASSTRWISSCSPGDPLPCWRSTTPGAGTTRTKVRGCPCHRLVPWGVGESRADVSKVNKVPVSSYSASLELYILSAQISQCKAISVKRLLLAVFFMLFKYLMWLFKKV